MDEVSVDAVQALGRAAGLDLGRDVEAVRERLGQLSAFARELDGLVTDETAIDAGFDPSWDAPR